MASRDDEEVKVYIKLGEQEEYAISRVARMTAETLSDISKLVKVCAIHDSSKRLTSYQLGIATAPLDQAVHVLIIARRAYSSLLAYSNFPRSCPIPDHNFIARRCLLLDVYIVGIH